MFLSDNLIRKRALKAIRNSCFKKYFYEFIKKKGLGSNDILLKKEDYLKKRFFKYETRDGIENKIITLIRAGVLRREVDGQGLTEKVRLTPLGREILKEFFKKDQPKNNFLIKTFKCLRGKIKFI